MPTEPELVWCADCDMPGGLHRRGCCQVGPECGDCADDKLCDCWLPESNRRARAELVSKTIEFTRALGRLHRATKRKPSPPDDS